MIIKKISILNFGTLSNYELDLHEGLNKILEENGFGKTTLSIFIKAMFYGLVDSRSKKPEANERIKYRPWNGQTMGGSLVFEYKNTTYRIERTFGETASSDKFNLYNVDTNKESKDFSKKIGEEIFELSVNSFEKSCFTLQKETSGETSDDIISKLTSLLETSSDSFTYAEASKILENKIKTYKSGKNGLLLTLEDKIKETEKALEEIKNCENENKDYKKTINENKEIIRGLEEKDRITKDKINNSSLQLAKIEIEENYNKMKENIVTLENEKKLIGKVINIEQEQQINTYLNQIKDKNNELEGLKNDSAFSVNSSYEKQKINEITIDELNSIKNNIAKYYQNNQEIQNNKFNSEEYNNLSDFFIGGFNDWEFNELKKTYEESKNVSKKSGYIIYIIMGILFAIFCTGGILLYKTNMLFTIIAFCMAILLILGMFFIFVYRFVRNNTNNENKNVNLNKCRKYLSKYKVNLNDSIEKNITEIEYKISRFNELTNEKNYKENGIKELEKHNNNLFNDFSSKLKKYGYDNEDYQANIVLLSDAYNKYISNKQKIIAINQRIEMIDSDIITINKNIDLVFENIGYKITDYSLASLLRSADLLSKNRIKYEELCKKIEYTKKEFDLYVSDKKIDDEFFKYERIDVEGLKKLDEEYSQKIKKLIETNAFIQTKVDINEQKINDKVIFEGQLTDLNNNLESSNKEYKLLIKTQDYLLRAKENLSSNYIKPLKNSFIKYSTLVDKDILGKVFIDTDLNVKVEGLGLQRDIEFFSQGYKDIIDFCMRMALVENLFKKEKPVLLLDDPFTNLDDEKMKVAKDILMNVSKDYQIIYLVCNSSRV